jgi:hypothetical protein
MYEFMCFHIQILEWNLSKFEPLFLELKFQYMLNFELWFLEWNFK